MRYTIENDYLQVGIDSKGCELVSVIDKAGEEHIWEGNPDVWKRHAPVLFPLVGKYQQNISVYEEKEYHMGQHGFARDMEFELVEQTETSICMRLTQTEETLQKYPFAFVLECGFSLEKNRIRVTWKVKNPSDTAMYFSIGGHPAFVSEEGTVTGHTLTYFKDGQALTNLEYRLLGEEGLVAPDTYVLALEQGKQVITEHTFDKDAYIIEGNQADKVVLSDKNGAQIVAVEMDAPVFGIWSAPKTGNRFVCIEPWYGRADAQGFTGELEKREWGNVLNAGEEFAREYRIEI